MNYLATSLHMRRLISFAHAKGEIPHIFTVAAGDEKALLSAMHKPLLSVSGGTFFGVPCVVSYEARQTTLDTRTTP